MTNPEIPPIAEPVTPPAPLIEPKPDNGITKLYEEVLREKEQKLREQNEELIALRSKVAAPPAPAADAKEYFDRPQETVDAIVKRRMDEALGPINARLAAGQRMEDYRRIKALVAKDERAAPFWQYIESDLDSLANAWTGDMTVEVVAATVRDLIGRFAVSNAAKYVEIINGGSITPKPPGSMTTTPPQIPPSSPPLPTPPASPAAGTLTELEKRLAREQWPSLSPEDAFKEYLKLRDPGSFEVTGKKAGK